MSANDDAALLNAIAGGDQKSMEVFYHRHSSAVYYFAFKTLNNGADAAEVMNEVMMEVWRKASTFSGKSAVKTWLLSIAHHKAVDTVRRKARHDATDEVPEQADDEAHCSLELAQAGAEDNDRVKKCMGELKDGHRQVVYLTFFEGLAYPDIAGILDIPPGTVKTRMMHAKNQLKACLARLLGSAAPA